VGGTSEDLEAAGSALRRREELEQAARHCRTAASHMRNREVPRGAAHAWAAFGHLDVAGERLREQARTHARKSNP
jgi:hypothetical protein